MAKVAAGLVGRERELAVLEDLVRRGGVHGASLVVRGEPGIGKSALLAETSARARELAMDVMAATGAESEAQLPFAALHGLLRPCLEHVDELAPPQRAAIRAAFGIDDDAAPDPFLIALAALELLVERAARSPLVLVVDDAQWIDRPSADALMFVARRVAMEPIVLLLGVRTGPNDPFARAELPQLTIEALDPDASAALLDAHAPELEPDVRRRVLEEAAGNPLALLELPVGLRSLAPSKRARGALPLTARLESVFAVRVSELPDRVRALLLVAAANDGGPLGELLAAASDVAGSALTFDDLDPAVEAGAVEIDDGVLRFRHPLVRSAIYQSASVADRNRAHTALAAVVPDSDRAVWHRAASVVGVDEQVSAALEDAAASALRRGAPGPAAAALERSARLTGNLARRALLLVRAGETELNLGHAEVGLQLLREAEQLELSAHDRVRLTFLLEVFEQRAWSGASRVAAFVEIANELTATGDGAGALDALRAVALRSWWGNAEPATRSAVVAAAERIGLSDDDPRLLEVIAHADPVGQATTVLDRLSRIDPDTAEPLDALAAGTAASAVWAEDRSLPYYETAIRGIRAQGRLGLLVQALTYQAWAAVHRAREELAVASAEEAERLAVETGQLRWVASAQLARAAIATERGDAATADELAGKAEAIIVDQGANQMLALVQFVRGRGASAHQHYDEAVAHLTQIFDPAAPAYQPLLGTWAYADLIEAAANTGDVELAHEHFDSLESLVARTSAPLLAAQASYVRPILAADGEAEESFQSGAPVGAEGVAVLPRPDVPLVRRLATAPAARRGVPGSASRRA